MNPNSSIRLLKNVPLDPDYVNTVSFNSLNAQTEYFTTTQSLQLYNVAASQWVRVNAKQIRVPFNADALALCNYMAFQNPRTISGVSYNKWFYAFVTAVEYVNEGTSLLTFEIDVLQTWMFNYQLNEVFVEREHSATDEPGDNIISEPIEVGPYVVDSPQSVLQPDDTTQTKYCIVAFATWMYDEASNTFTDWIGSISSGVYSGLFPNVFYVPNDGPGQLEVANRINLMMERAAEAAKIDGLTYFALFPSKYFQELQALASFQTTETFDVIRPTAIGTYTPKNKKLLTYPYTFVYVTNGIGGSSEFAYEFSDLDPSIIRIIATANSRGPAEVVVYPHQYLGFGAYLEGKVTLSNFPQLGYNTDNYKLWLAQHEAQMITGAINSVVSLGSGVARIAAGDASGAGQVLGVLNDIGRFIDTQKMPDTGTQTTGTISVAGMQELDIKICKKRITEQYARRIDDFFTMFGYACGLVKVPNGTRRTPASASARREQFNYVKTIGCTINGSIPASDEKKICSIYDKGVTIWHNPASVGDYSLDNPPHVY